jgi:hypothetical protein
MPVQVMLEPVRIYVSGTIDAVERWGLLTTPIRST